MAKTRIPAQRGSRPSLLVLDLGSLRFERLPGSDRVAAFTASRRLLGAVSVEQDTTEREAVFQLLDHLLASGVPDVDAVTHVCALYNPVTWQVALHAVPDTVSYGDHIPLTLDPEGTLGYVEDGVLNVAGRRLGVFEPSMLLVRQAFAAHRD